VWKAVFAFAENCKKKKRGFDLHIAGFRRVWIKVYFSSFGSNTMSVFEKV